MAANVPQSFDLSALEARVHVTGAPARRFLLRSQVALVLMWAIFSALAAAKTAQSWGSIVRTPQSDWGYLGLWGVLAFMGATCFWLLASTLKQRSAHNDRGPTRLNLEPDGFSLIWAKGPPANCKWKSLHRNLTVMDFTLAGPDHGSRLQFVPESWSQRKVTAITNEAAAALVSSAQDAGLRLKRSQIVSSAKKPGVMTVISRET